MIYFEGLSGLCNRLRAISSAYRFALKENSPLTIIWSYDVGCNQSFDNLFKLRQEGTIPVSFVYPRRFRRMGYNIDIFPFFNYRKVRKEIQNRCVPVYGERTYKILNGRTDVEDLAEEIRGKDVYLDSWDYWYPSEKPFEMFEVKEGIWEKIQEFKEQCGEHCVGVHVRRTDHQMAISQSPTELFIERMQEEIEKYPDTKFFLASDDLDEKKRLIETFGKERIITNQGAILKRNTKQGMEHAVIDLYVLSEMNKIFGSSGSSFSEVASMIRGIPLISCEAKKDPAV